MISSSVTPRARAVVGAPIASNASRTSCQFPPWRYIIMIVPKVPREGPVLHRREVRDDVAAPGGEEPERGLCDDARVHDHRDGRLGSDAHLLAVLLDRRPRGHDAVVARGGRHADERHAGIE